MGNTIRTWALMALLSVLLVLIGGLFGRGGMIFAFIFAFLMNFFAYWFSDKLVLAMYRAKKVGENETPQLHRIVKELAQKANLPMPKVYIIPSQTPNAFATGRNPTTTHLFIVNPLRPSGLMTLFSTHPPIEERINRLEKMVMQ